MTALPKVPSVLVFAGLDPSGGAGLQADIEALGSMGCHPCPIATSLTVQDTHNVQRQSPVHPDLIQAQCELLMSDISITGVKIGLLANSGIADVVARLLKTLPDIPVVMDPVLAASGGTQLSDAALLETMDALLPQITLLTPNQQEAHRLTGQKTQDAQAKALLDRGCEMVLITGADAHTAAVENRLYAQQGLLETYPWERLPGSFHGTGCTLSSAVCGLLAQGHDPRRAVADAQRYTWETLYEAYAVGQGQSIPNRLFWAHRDASETTERGADHEG